MAFRDDNAGFVFSCDDAKLSFQAGTWSTRLSQLGKLSGAVYIITAQLEDVGYISRVSEKRPSNIFIIAHSTAWENAEELKRKFPLVAIRLHPSINAKIALIAPETVWLSSGDFGKTEKIESTVGMHSATLFERVRDSHFNKLWGDLPPDLVRHRHRVQG